ncbi:MAG: lipid-A-disaccharide synthase, partial [Endomicrobiia bacterium]
MNNREIFISCGDPSGDFHASNLAKEIKKIAPEIKITSIGGEEIKKASDNFLYNIVDLHLHGFWEPVKQYFNLRKFFNEKVVNYLKNSKPKAVIPVDFYGFNIKLAEKAKSLEIPVYYYISPQIWATRKGRIKKLKKYIDHIFVIFPFEEEIYRKAGISVDFVGHPLLDVVPQPNTDNKIKD